MKLYRIEKDSQAMSILSLVVDACENADRDLSLAFEDGGTVSYKIGEGVWSAPLPTTASAR